MGLFWTNLSNKRFYLLNIIFIFDVHRMAKIRKISSIENGVAEVIKILSEDEIEEAIGKGVSFLKMQ